MKSLAVQVVLLGNKIMSTMIRFLSATAAIAIGLSACGGGGGSSSVGGGGGPSGSSNTSFPSTFSGSVEENSNPENYIRRSFKYNAPSDNAPSNLTVTGSDAQFFEVIIEASIAASNGDRDVTVSVRRNQDAVRFEENFEFPQDENKDNVYEFSFSGT